MSTDLTGQRISIDDRQESSTEVSFVGDGGAERARGTFSSSPARTCEIKASENVECLFSGCAVMRFM